MPNNRIIRDDLKSETVIPKLRDVAHAKAEICRTASIWSMTKKEAIEFPLYQDIARYFEFDLSALYVSPSLDGKGFDTFMFMDDEIQGEYPRLEELEDKGEPIGRVLATGSMSAMSALMNQRIKESLPTPNMDMLEVPDLSGSSTHVLVDSMVPDIHMLVELGNLVMNAPLTMGKQEVSCLLNLDRMMDAPKAPKIPFGLGAMPKRERRSASQMRGGRAR